jgi:hypothetical protein
MIIYQFDYELALKEPSVYTYLDNVDKEKAISKFFHSTFVFLLNREKEKLFLYLLNRMINKPWNQ